MQQDEIHWHIIANPAAGKGSVARKWPIIERMLQEMSFSYSVHFTEKKDHALRLVDDVVLRGGRYIMGIGGDGTNHEVINGLLAQNWVPSADIHYALLPCGTGNDWARMYSIPTDVKQRLLRLREMRIVWQDAGKVEFQAENVQKSRFFVNIAGLAYDGYIGKQLARQPAANKADYLLRVAKHLLEYELSGAKITFDGKEVEDFFYTINVGLCRYSGAGMQLVPQAIPDDGLFGLTFAGRLPKWEVLFQTHRFYNGTLLQHPKVTGTQAKSIEVDHLPAQPPLFLEADGEFLGETPVRFTLLERALRIVL
jgi:diacylglycerol kinase (ATP)